MKRIYFSMMLMSCALVLTGCKTQEGIARWNAFVQGFTQSMRQQYGSRTTTTGGFQYTPSQAPSSTTRVQPVPFEYDGSQVIPSTTPYASSTAGSSQDDSYEFVASVTALKVNTAHSSGSSQYETLQIYKYTTTGSYYALIGGRYHVLAKNINTNFLGNNVSSYAKQVSYSSYIYFLNV